MKKCKMDFKFDSYSAPLVDAIYELNGMNTGDILIMSTDNDLSKEQIITLANKNNYPVEVKQLENGKVDIFIEKR